MHSLNFLGSLSTWDKSQQKALLLSANFLQYLKNEIRCNTQGLPVGYLDPSAVISYYGTYRVDSIDLPEEEFYVRTSLEEVHKACKCFLPLKYLDGYPMTPWGVPYWERLDSEPTEYYELFHAYRESTYARQLVLGEGLDSKSPMRSARSIYTIAKRADIDPKILMTLSVLYSWHDRAKSYDLYNMHQLEQRKTAEQQYMAGEHARAARRIFKNALDYIEHNLDQLNPKTALDWFQAAVQLERLSLGMDPTKPPSTEEEEKLRQDRRSWVQVNVNNMHGAGPAAAANAAGQGMGIGGGQDIDAKFAGEDSDGIIRSRPSQANDNLDRLELIIRTLQQAGALQQSQQGNAPSELQEVSE